MKGIYILVVSLVATLLCGCASVGKDSLAKLSLGMSKKEVIELLGPPDSIRGATITQDGQKVEVLEYYVVLNPLYDPIRYWLRILDGKLVNWGRPEDWTPDKVLEVRMR